MILARNKKRGGGVEREKQNRARRIMRLEEGVNLDFKLTIRAKNNLRMLRQILK